MDKITEEVLTRLIQRIEQLEQKFEKYESNKSTKSGPIKDQTSTKPGLASVDQIKFIKGLGGEPWEEMTKQEATKYIDELKARKNSKQTIPPVEFSQGTIKKLTSEEIAELEKEGALL